MIDDPITEAEFIALQRKPRLYAQWCEHVRNRWTANRCRARPDVGAVREHLALGTCGAALPNKEPKQ